MTSFVGMSLILLVVLGVLIVMGRRGAVRMRESERAVNECLEEAVQLGDRYQRVKGRMPTEVGEIADKLKGDKK